MPDMDIDFADDRRDEVIEYVVQRYGRDRVAQIITFNVLKAKAVIRDVGRVLGMPFGDVDKIAKLVPDTLNITLDDAFKQSPPLAEAVKGRPEVAELWQTAKRLEGLARHAGKHAAGRGDLRRAAHGARPALPGPQERGDHHPVPDGAHREARAPQDGLPRVSGR